MKTGKKILTLMLACAMVTSTAFVTYSVVDKATVSVSATEETPTSKDLVESEDFELGTTISDSILEGEERYYKIVLENPGKLSIDISGSNPRGNMKYLVAHLFDSSFETDYGKIEGETSPFKNSDTYYLYAGTYYLQLHDYFRTFQEATTTSFSLTSTFEEVESNVPNNNHDYKSAVSVEKGNVYHTILSEDVAAKDGDWYKLTLAEDSSLDFFFEYNNGAEFDFSIYACEDETTGVPADSNLLREEISEGGLIGVGHSVKDIKLNKGIYYVVIGNRTPSIWHTTNPCEYSFYFKNSGEDPTDPTDPTTPTTPTNPTTPTTPTVPTTPTTPITPTGTTPYNPAPNPTPTPTPNGKTVDTGAEMPLLAVFTLAASSAAVAFLRKRREDNNN